MQGQIFDQEKLKVYSKKGFSIYLAVSMCFLLYLLSIWALKGREGFRIIFQKGPISDVPMTIFYASVAWLLFGSVLVLLQKKNLTRDNLIVYSAFFINAFLYLNVLTEKITYGDYWDYINAAFNLSVGEPVNQRYLYPPFWATLLQPLVPLGRDAMTVMLKAVNYASLLLFFTLLYRVCRRYGLAKMPSALAVFVVTAVNVPVLRTLGYVQVNIHVINLILLSLLFSKKHVYLSALALSLAVHIKMTPVLLVIPFLWIKDWKWLRWFVVNTAGIVLFTSLMNCIGYYLDLYFLKNVRTILSVPETIAYRDCSVESFFRATFLNLHLSLKAALFIAYVLKIGLVILTLWILKKTVERPPYFQGEKRMEVIHNGYIVLIVLMTVLSPIVWVHHLVFLVFPFLIILKRLTKIGDYFLYGTAYFNVFLLPVFDFYPFSYLRLLGVAICFFLLYRFSKEEK